MLNSNGPRTDPCGTPWSNSFRKLNNVLILVFYQRLTQYFNNNIKESLPNL